MGMRVAAYCRVSTDSADQLHSLAAQRSYFEEAVRTHPGWELAGIYADEGVTGTSARRRTEFLRMIGDAAAGKLDLIVTKEVSRFARNTVDALEYTRRLRRMGVGVLFLNDGIDTREGDGEFRLAILASVAQEESRKTSERVKWGQRRSMEQGVVFGGAPYGFTLAGGRLVPKEPEAAAVRLIYTKYLEEGKGARRIARELDEAGVPPPRAARWSGATVLRILQNEKMAGDLCQRKSVTTDYLTHRREPNRVPGELVTLRGHHAGLVSRADWERAQAELARRRPGKAVSRPSARHWCSGRLRCGLCGAPLLPRSGGHKLPYLAWECAARLRGEGCALPLLNDKALRAVMDAAAAALGLDWERLSRELLAELSSAAPPDGARIAEKKRRLLDAYLSSYLSREEFAARQAECDAALARAVRPAEGLEAAVRECRTGGEWLWRELVREAEVYPGELAVHFFRVPASLRIAYTTAGRGENYRVTIEDRRWED